MNSGVVAQDVQVSQYPYRYQGYLPKADGLIAKLYDEGGPLDPGYTLAYTGTTGREIVAQKQNFNDLVAAASNNNSGRPRSRATSTSTPASSSVKCGERQTALSTRGSRRRTSAPAAGSPAAH